MQIKADRRVLPLQRVRGESLNLGVRQHTGIKHLRLPMRPNISTAARACKCAESQASPKKVFFPRKSKKKKRKVILSRDRCAALSAL